MKIILTVFSLLLLLNPLFAQADKAVFDSIYNQLPAMPEDTAKVKALNTLALSARKFDPPLAQQLAGQALKLSQQLDYPAGTGDAYNVMGLLKYYESDYEAALELHMAALEAKKRTGDKLEISRQYNDIANVYADKGDLKAAISYYEKGLKEAEEAGDKKQQTKLLANIGSIFHEQEDTAKALEYYQKALAQTDTSTLDNAQTIFVIHANIGLILKNQGRLDEALEHYYVSLDWRERIGYTRGVGQMKVNIGEVLVMQGSKDEGKAMIEEGVAVLREVKDRYGVGSSIGTLGEMEYAAGNYDLAKQYYAEALEFAEEVGSLQLLRDSYEAMAEVNGQLGNYQDAYQYQLKYQEMKDSVLSLETNEIIAEWQTRYETTEKERQIETQQLKIQQQTQRNRLQMIIFMLSVIFILLTAGLLYNRYKLKQEALFERRMIDEQKLRFRTVVEAQEQERKRIAQDLHDGLGQLLSTARLNVSALEDELDTTDPESTRLWNISLQLIDESVQEVRNVSHNMMPSALIRLGLVSALREQVQKINAAGRVQVSLETEGLDARLEEGVEISIYRIVQEVLNNTLKHAQATQILVSLKQQGGRLQINVKDNGKGMGADAVANSTGIGWKNIYSRVELLNGQLNMSTAPGQGTDIQVVVPAA